MARWLKYVIPVILLSLLVILILNYGRKTGMVYNAEDAAGNTPGNLFNGGLFCENGDRIFFSNKNDDGTLYSMDLNMKDFKKLYNDKVCYINSAGNYIYYSRLNYDKENSGSNVFTFDTTGIYRLTASGTNLKQLYDDPTGILNLYGNYIYYQHYNKDTGLKFYKVKIDATGEEMVSNEPLEPISITDNTLYYMGTEINHAVYTMDLLTGTVSKFSDEECYEPVINNAYLYYMSIKDNYNIYRMDLSNGKKKRIVDERCCTFNVTADGSHLYYQVDNNENNRICQLNLKTMESETLMEGDFKNIHITSNYVFFSDFEDTNTYYSEIGNSKSVTIFTPPNLSKK